jgi:phage shock protein PspC (stress-responsive transcriptional regulator)/signal transduction histidine kinase
MVAAAPKGHHGRVDEPVVGEPIPAEPRPGGPPWESWRRRRDGGFREERFSGPGFRRHGFGGPLGGPSLRPYGRRRRGGCGPFRRRPDEAMLGGVAAGLAGRTGFDVTLVRAGFALATLAGGVGFAVYVLCWLLLPSSDGSPPIAQRAINDRRGVALAAALASVLLLLLVLGAALHVGWLGSVGWPVVIGLTGLVLIWRNAPAAEQGALRRLAEPVLGMFGVGGRSRTHVALRLLVGLVLVGAGVYLLLEGHGHRGVLRPIGGVLAILAATIAVLAPWWLRVARDLVLERQARARAEERAEMAARVHDSVLQTLALIQRRAEDPQQVVRLARAQERELRGWLFDGATPGSLERAGLTVSAGVRALQEDVEAQHGIRVDAVTVGDCPVDDRLEPLLAAAREAAVNAAKWSGAPVVSLFVEVEPDSVAVFVRDRGRGFDPASVAADRKGLAESVHGRVTRYGGTAVVRSAPGEGTEVVLTMPRRAGATHP